MTSAHNIIDKTVYIHAPVSVVWRNLTTPNLMKQWMTDAGIEIDIVTDWSIGNPICMKGILHRIKFENKGTILKCEVEKTLQYSHVSSLSRLPDAPESYSTIEFRLTPIDNHTKLNLTITNFPTETIFKHLDFYWKSTLEIMKKLIEKSI